MRVIVSGGGTGGHIFPAIAIANEIKAQYPQTAILFVGAKDKMEMQKVPEAGYQIEGLWISGIQRSLSIKNLAFPFQLISSLIKSIAILRRFKPDIVVGVGGFASGAVMYAANWLNIPTLIQEQNSYPGITNKLLANKARLICVAYPNMERYFPAEKIVLTGNPVRQSIIEIENVSRNEAYHFFGLDAQKPTLLAVGGSLGAKSINEAILNAIPTLIEKGWQLIWQTGKSFENQMTDLQKKYAKQGIIISTFIKEIELAYAACDVVVSRAGALAVSELCLVGKPTIFVPYPYAAEDHQTKNAQALVEKKAALLVKDAAMTTDFLPTLLQLLEDKNLQQTLRSNIVKLAQKQATKEIVKHIQSICSNLKN
jgi:UDP-N-acetylglucosamine--N-acetylmuramyl-(pentapeptide) pyrophosphoryl-undecaprenol N-acetylglucosamine transferase